MTILWQYLCRLKTQFPDIMREKIMDTAKALFIKRGVRDVNIDEICHALGMSKKTFYQYYESKEDLVGTVVSCHMEEIRKWFFCLIREKDPVEVLAILFTMKPKTNMMVHKKISEDVFKYYHDSFVSHTKKTFKFVREGMEDFLVRGMEEGVFRKDLDINGVLTLFILLQRGIGQYIDGLAIIEGKKLSEKSLIKAYQDMVVHTVLTDEGWIRYNEIMAKTMDGKQTENKEETTNS